MDDEDVELSHDQSRWNDSPLSHEGFLSNGAVEVQRR